MQRRDTHSCKCLMDLFGDDPVAPSRPTSERRKQESVVEPAGVDSELEAVAAGLPRALHLGTSSWSFPGWKGIVWASDHSDSALARTGLPVYARHPMLRTVSLDRAFYRPLAAAEYAAYAAQVPDDFRFIVKAPQLVCDALVRGPDGRAKQDNPAFLDPVLARTAFVQPALEGLGRKIGALVFQLSPLPAWRLARMEGLLEQLEAMLAGLPALEPVAPGAVVAVEVRDPEFLGPAFAALLKRVRATYCLGLHPRLPPIGEQLPMLRALWPGPLVCRWSLNRKHGSDGYGVAKEGYRPFDKTVDPDPATRDALARIVAGTVSSGWSVYVAINNKAEGSAPLSVIALARAVASLLEHKSLTTATE
jgi:uncharacterized protein YecE (DUF72 family)